MTPRRVVILLGAGVVVIAFARFVVEKLHQARAVMLRDDCDDPRRELVLLCYFDSLLDVIGKNNRRHLG